MIPSSYRPRKKFMELAVSEAKRARDRGDYPIGAVITRLTGGREVVIASAGNRVKTSGSSIKHVELETLKYVSSGYGRYLPDFVLYSTHEPCAMCAGACVWSRIGAVVYGVSQEDIAAYGRKHGTENYKWRACLKPLSLAKTSNVLFEHSGRGRSQRLRSQGSRVKTMMVQIRLLRAGSQELFTTMSAMSMPNSILPSHRQAGG